MKELSEALREILKLMDDRLLVRNTDQDHDVRAFMNQGIRIARVLKMAQVALDKSAVE